MSHLEGYENLLSLMTIYRDEWKHRCEEQRSLFWRFVYISLVVTFLPNLTEKIGASSSLSLLKLPTPIFCAAGILCALFGLLLSLGCTKRIDSVDQAFKRLMDELPVNYRYQPFNLPDQGIWGRLFALKLNPILCIGTYLVVIFLAIVNCYYWYHPII